VEEGYQVGLFEAGGAGNVKILIEFITINTSLYRELIEFLYTGRDQLHQVPRPDASTPD